jgi:hypothetical protein
MQFEINWGKGQGRKGAWQAPEAEKATMARTMRFFPACNEPESEPQDPHKQ